MDTVEHPKAALGQTRRMMLATLAASTLTPAGLRADMRDRLGIPGPLSFDGASYALAWSSQPSPSYTKQEYLPAGQSSGSYASMLLVEVVEGGTTVEAALGAQIRLLNGRKGQDPLVNFSAIRNRKTGEAILDFIIGGRTPQGAPIAEWNAYRYAPRQQGGVMLFAISRRAYGEADIRAFLTGLKGERPGLVNRLAQQALPVERR
jgi:hypothetical protein